MFERKSPEIYLLLIPSILFIFLSFFFWTIFRSSTSSETIFKSMALMIDGSKIIGLVFCVAGIFALFVLGTYFLRYKKGDRKAMPEAFKYFKSLSFIFTVSAVMILSWIALSTVLFSNISVDRVIDASEKMVSAEFFIFRAFPAYGSQILPHFFETIILYSYHGIFLLGGIAIVIGFMFSKRIFRVSLLALSMFYLCAYAIWILVPALAPGPLLFLFETMGFVFPEPEVQRLAMSFNPSFLLSQYLHYLPNYLFTPDFSFVTVSAFPSAHAGWSIILTYSAVSVWRPLKFIYFPFFFFLILGTVYLLQHYALDPLVGVLIGALCIKTAEKIISQDKTNGGYLLFALDEHNLLCDKILRKMKISKR